VLFYFNHNIDAHYIPAEEIRKKIIPVSLLSNDESTLNDGAQIMFY
jgi:hypothetical protein